MKAFLLAGGLGSRLRPITDTVPKCLVPIAGKPLLSWWLELLESHGVTEVLINTHHLAEQVRIFIKVHNSQSGIPYIHEFYEPVLLGSGGTVKANGKFVSAKESFLICYADNLTKINLSNLIAFHKSHNGCLTMALFRVDNPTQCGIVEIDSNGRIIDFIEKPLNPKDNLANAGVYIANQSIFSFFPNQEFIDFGRDILPLLINQMYGFEIHEYHLDIGTPQNLQKARNEWRNDNF